MSRAVQASVGTLLRRVVEALVATRGVRMVPTLETRRGVARRACRSAWGAAWGVGRGAIYGRPSMAPDFVGRSKWFRTNETPDAMWRRAFGSFV